MRDSDSIPSAGPGQSSWSADEGCVDWRTRRDRAVELDPSPGVRNRILPTGISDCEAAGRVNGIHVLGVARGSPMATTRLTGAITGYDPDLVAVQTDREEIGYYHPDVYDPRWPPRDEVEAAAFATDHMDELLISGIDTLDQTQRVVTDRSTREIFVELGFAESKYESPLETLYDLDVAMIRQWRAALLDRYPVKFREDVLVPDEVMAGHLQALIDIEGIETIVAAVGIPHLTGVLDRLADPDQIPEEVVTVPPTANYFTI